MEFNYFSIAFEPLQLQYVKIKITFWRYVCIVTSYTGNNKNYSSMHCDFQKS